MIVLSEQSVNELYGKACSAVCGDGLRVSPRGLPTVEVLGAHMCLRQPRRRYLDVPPVRVINPAFAVAEAMWILSGSDDPWIFRYNRSLRRYADNGKLQGAYGPRMRCWRGTIDQLDRVRTLLARDPESRQAVIQLFDPGRDGRGHRDVPCTLNYRFYVRQGRLDMHTTMRSQDLWLGFPYDLFTATMLQELLAGWLGVELGAYHHHVDSLHLYVQHIDAARTVVENVQPSIKMPPIGLPWDALQGTVAGVVADALPVDAGPQWQGFARTMASYRAWTGGDRTGAQALAEFVPGDLGRALERWYARLTAGPTEARDGRKVTST